MDIAGQIAGIAGESPNSIDVTMLKKAQDTQAQGAAQLIANLPPPQSANAAGVGAQFDATA